MHSIRPGSRLLIWILHDGNFGRPTAWRHQASRHSLGRHRRRGASLFIAARSPLPLYHTQQTRKWPSRRDARNNAVRSRFGKTCISVRVTAQVLGSPYTFTSLPTETIKFCNLFSLNVTEDRYFMLKNILGLCCARLVFALLNLSIIFFLFYDLTEFQRTGTNSGGCLLLPLSKDELL